MLVLPLYCSYFLTEAMPLTRRNHHGCAHRNDCGMGASRPPQVGGRGVALRVPLRWVVSVV